MIEIGRGLQAIGLILLLVFTSAVAGCTNVRGGDHEFGGGGIPPFH